MTAGLEIHISDTGALMLVDRTPDARFATDVSTWNSALGLNTASAQKTKDAYPAR